MPITAEEREQVVSELKRIGGELNLTDQQREKLQATLVEAREKLAEYLKKNPGTTRADIVAKVKAHRDEIRQRVANFLSPEQLTKWNAETAKMKEFLGTKTRRLIAGVSTTWFPQFLKSWGNPRRRRRAVSLQEKPRKQKQILRHGYPTDVVRVAPSLRGSG